MATDEKVRATAVKKELNAFGRHFVVNDTVIGSETKKYVWLEEDTKLLRFAAGSLGTLSDAFILYAVAMLGVSDRDSIQNFLKAYSKKNPALSIADPTDMDNLRSRIKDLTRNGFLFRSGYEYEAINKDNGGTCLNEGVVYTIDEGGLRFMCQKLGCKILANQWIAAKPLEELIAWASSSFVITNMSLDKSFVEFKQGIFKSRELKVTMMTAELITSVDDEEYCIAAIPAFLHQNRTRQTDKDFKRMKKDRIAIVRNYLLNRAAQDKNPYMVIACEDLNDMEKMAANIIDEGSLLEYTSRVFLTGEGAIRTKGRNIADSMFRLAPDDNGNYGLVLSKAPFLTGERVSFGLT